MDAEEARNNLRIATVLSTLSDEALAQLAHEISWNRVAAGMTVVPHLDRRQSVYFLIEGICRARINGPTGRTFSVRRLETGAHFGEIAALTGAPRTVEIVAETDVLIAECPKAAFDALMAKEPRVAKAIATSLARTIISLTDRLFEFATLEARFRLYAELMRLARDAEETPEGMLIKNMPTREILASTIGSQREYVSREIANLETEGVVARSRNQTLLIRNIERLRTLTQNRSGVTASQLLEWEI